MNERIKLLAEQATSYMPGQPPYDGLTFDMFDKEKFAELIVRECVSVAMEQYDDTLPWGGVEDVLKHFGVDE